MSFASEVDNWFHGKVTRENAAHLVTTGPQGRREGLFVVRESLRLAGSFVLTMWARNQVHHFQIVGHGDGWFSVDNGPLFQGLDELIHHYLTRPDGLPAQLNEFVLGTAPPLNSRARKETDLHRAVNKRDLASVMRIVASPLSDQLGTPESQNGEGSTPIHEMAKKGYVDILDKLIDKKPDITIRDSKGSTALQLAARNGHADVVRMLVERGGADVQERNATTGWVALHEAAFRGHMECVKTLLQLNAPLRPRTPDEDTPKELASRYKQREVVELLEWAASNYPKPRTTTAEWLHKATDRNKAVTMLTRRGGQGDGSFLIRPNSRRPGYYALTLVHTLMPYHYEIVCESDLWYFIDDGPLFDSLPAVIDHYMLFQDGLPTVLRYPVNSSGKKITPSKLPPQGKLLFANIPTRSRPPLPLPPVITTSAGGPPVRHRDSSVANGRSEPPRLVSACQWVKHPLDSFRLILKLGTKRILKNAFLQGDVVFMSSQPPPPPPGLLKPNSRTDNNYEMMCINESWLTLGEELGQGEFGSVLKGKYKPPNERMMDVAVKTLRVDTMGHGEQEFMREAKIMVTLNHPCIVKLIGVTRGKPLMLIQELVPMGALIDYLYEGRYPRPSITTLKLWAAEIAYGMTYLEKKRFVHRDLAARNILVASETEVKISDFGLSRAVGANSDYYKASQGGRWPVKWYAPESINYGTFSHASDIWSYGITLWEMFSYGEPPYGEMTGADVLELIENQNYRLDKPSGCPDSTYRTMLSCWSLEPANRPNFVDLHRAFTSEPEYKDISCHMDLYQNPSDIMR